MEHPPKKWWRILPPELSDELSHFVSDSFCRKTLISTNSLFYLLLHLTKRADRWKSENIDNAELNTMYSVVADQPPPPPPVMQQIRRSRLFCPVLSAFQSIRPPLQLLHHFVSPQRFNIPRQAVAHFQPIFPHTFRPIVPRLSHHRSSSEAWGEGLCLVNFSHRINWDTRRIVVILRARVQNGRELVRGHFTQERTARIEQYFGCGFVFYQLPQVQWDAAIVTFYGPLYNWDELMLHLYDVLTSIEQETEPPNITSPTPNSSPNSNGQKTPENAESPSGAVASPNAADPSSNATNSSSVTGSPNAGESCSNAANSSFWLYSCLRVLSFLC